MKAIDNKELIIALEELEKEKGIKKEELLESIRTALITAYKRNFDALENVDVKMDEQTGATHVYAIKEVMERANDDALEISLEDARKINKELNLGDSVEVEIVPRDFGRIAAQTAKQVIIQKLRETERNMIFNEYNERKGEIVTGLVQKADNHIVVLDLGKLEGIMLSKDQIPTEHYKVNDKIKVIIKEKSEENKSIKISVKDLLEDPFKNIRKDFTEKGEYLATITGYTDNGIFANIAQGVDTVCILPTWLDRPPFPGEKVIIKIYKIIPEKRKIYSSLIKIMGSDASE